MLSAFIATILLGTIAGLHLLWAGGSHWPAKSESDLARQVTGFPGATTMPPKWASFAVALILLFGAHVLLTGAGVMAPLVPMWLYQIGCWGMVGVFAMRGFAVYTPQWRALTPEQPFAKLDRRYFGPLCLLLAGLSLLTVL